MHPDPTNAREHNERNIASIAESLRTFGLQKPIVVDRDGLIRAAAVQRETPLKYRMGQPTDVDR